MAQSVLSSDPTRIPMKIGGFSMAREYEHTCGGTNHLRYSLHPGVGDHRPAALAGCQRREPIREEASNIPFPSLYATEGPLVAYATLETYLVAHEQSRHARLRIHVSSLRI